MWNIIMDYSSFEDILKLRQTNKMIRNLEESVKESRLESIYYKGPEVLVNFLKTLSDDEATAALKLLILHLDLGEKDSIWFDIAISMPVTKTSRHAIYMGKFTTEQKISIFLNLFMEADYEYITDERFSSSKKFDEMLIQTRLLDIDPKIGGDFLINFGDGYLCRLFYMNNLFDFSGLEYFIDNYDEEFEEVTFSMLAFYYTVYKDVDFEALSTEEVGDDFFHYLFVLESNFWVRFNIPDSFGLTLLETYMIDKFVSLVTYEFNNYLTTTVKNVTDRYNSEEVRNIFINALDNYYPDYNMNDYEEFLDQFFPLEE